MTAERAPFVMLPRWLLYHETVGEGAKFLYCILHDLVAGREGPTRPVTRAKLAELCRVSPNTIDRRLAELVTAGAVEKEPQILAGGQVANVYHVWLTPPDQRRHRIPPNGKPHPERLLIAGDPPLTGRMAVDNRIPTDGEARSQRIPAEGDPPHGWGASLPADGDPTVLEEEIQEAPPQPPRPAGGQRNFEMIGNNGDPAGSRRSRAAGTNPRAEADRAEAARLEAEASARQAELERRIKERRAADEAAEREARRLEEEALALSAALDDGTLAAIVGMVSASMAGPLARSPLAVARAVLSWCRTAATGHPGPLSDAIAAGLGAGLVVGEGNASTSLALPPAPPGTPSLRRRIGQLRETAGVA